MPRGRPLGNATLVPGPGRADQGELEEAVHGIAGLQAAVTEAVVDNQDAHNTIADYFFSDGPGISAVIVALADALYEAAIDQSSPIDEPCGR